MPACIARRVAWRTRARRKSPHARRNTPRPGRHWCAASCTVSPATQSSVEVEWYTLAVSDQPQDQLSILKLVTGRLDAAPIPYMVTGSIAAGHYGHPRMTRDIDIVVQVEPVDGPRLAAALGDEFAADSEMIGAAISRHSLFNVIHREAVVTVDFVIRKNSAYRIEEFGRRRLVEIDGHPLWMVTPEDLVLSKLVWARDSHSELQLRDVRSVLRFQQATLDRAYLNRWALSLSVDHLLREVES